MDKESAASERRFQELSRDFKAYVDMRQEETLSLFRVFRDDLRAQGETLRSHGEKLDRIERRLERIEQQGPAA